MNSRSRSLSLLALVVLLGVGFFGYRSWQDHARAADARAQLFVDLDRVLSAGDRNAPELSGLVARLKQMDGDDRQVALALGRVELLRGRFESAARHLEALVLAGGSLEELRAAARAWLGWQLGGGRDSNERRGLLRQALRFAESAHTAGGNAGDLLMAWQAALRLGETTTARQHGALLQQQHAGSLEARTVAMVDASGDLTQPIGPVEALLAEWPVPPIELRLMHAVLLLQNAAVDRAVAILDELLVLAPNLVEVRNFAATAHHMAGLLQPAGGERDRHLLMRDDQIRWLDANADLEDARRPQWLAMRQQR